MTRRWPPAARPAPAWPRPAGPGRAGARLPRVQQCVTSAFPLPRRRWQTRTISQRSRRATAWHHEYVCSWTQPTAPRLPWGQGTLREGPRPPAGNDGADLQRVQRGREADGRKPVRRFDAEDHLPDRCHGGSAGIDRAGGRPAIRWPPCACRSRCQRQLRAACAEG
ncbi:conserved hypothetical protein [Stenotrophomonas geniculata]